TLLASVSTATAALAQSEPPPAVKPANTPTSASPEKVAAKPAPQPPQPAPPSLDDLLGLKPKPKPDGTAPGADATKAGTPAVTDVAPDQSKADLDRLLT